MKRRVALEAGPSGLGVGLGPRLFPYAPAFDPTGPLWCRGSDGRLYYTGLHRGSVGTSGACRGERKAVRMGVETCRI